MKFQMLWDIKLNEVEGFAIVSMILGATVFLTAAFWDLVATEQIAHHEGFGWQQVTIMALSSLYVFWGYIIQKKWKE